MTESQSLFLRNPVLQGIYDRRSIRVFADQPVREEDIEEILRAANQAPSAHNQQSWRFIVLRGEPKLELANLVTEHAASFERPLSALLRMAARSIAGAPVVIAVANTGELIRRGDELFKLDQEATLDFFRTMEIQSSAAAVQNLLLAATSIGLGAVWLGALFVVKNDVLKFLGEPQGEFMAVIPVGYPAKDASAPRKKSMNSLVRYLD